MAHADHLGRPIRLTDATRATVWSASYDPFGQPWQVTGTVTQNLRFPGQFFLLESDLSYNWNRFYDAATGRYTQPDPLRFVDGPSVYGYAGASPMMRVDPEGQVSLCLPGSRDPMCGMIGGPELGGGGGVAGAGYGAGLLLGLACEWLMAVPNEWPKTGSCNASEIKYCEAQCGPRGVQGCYVSIGYAVKGVRGANIIRSQKRTVNCNCGDE